MLSDVLTSFFRVLFGNRTAALFNFNLNCERSADQYLLMEECLKDHASFAVNSERKSAKFN